MLLIGLAALAWLTSFGWAVLAPLRAAHRAALLPAAPVLGAALLAVVMSSTSWLVSARWGLVVTAVVAGGLVVVGIRRGRRPWRADRRAVLTAVVVTALGLGGAAVAMLPNLWVGDGRALSANGSHDIYYYVAETTYLVDHPVTPVPEAGAVPGAGASVPATNPMRAALTLPLRIGQSMVQAALTVGTGQESVDSVMVLMGLWVLLVAPSAFVAARLLRIGPPPAAVLAAVTSSSALLVHQHHQQNTDALLGVGLALLAVASCVAGVQRRIPLWPAALVLAALVAVYTEYALFVAPAVIGGVLLRRHAHVPGSLRRSAVLLALAVVIAPTAWVRAVGVLRIDRAADTATSPLADGGWALAISRSLGTAPLAGIGGSRATFVLAVLVVLGWLLAVVLGRHRGLWFLLLAVGLGYVALVTVQGRGYTQMRSASLLLPLLLLATVAGWSALLRVLRRSGPGGGRTRLRMQLAGALSIGLVASSGIWVLVNLRTAAGTLDRAFVTSRHVDATYDDLTGWVDDLGRGDGSDLTVLVPDLFAQNWVAHALRDEPLTSYPALRPDYLGTTSYWAGELDPYLLVGPGAHLDAEDAAVIESNERFTMVDMTRGAVVAVTPLELPTWVPAATAAGAMTGPDCGTILVIRSPFAEGPVSLVLGSRDELGTVEVIVTVSETGRTVRATVDADGEPVVVDLGDLLTATLEIDVAADGTGSAALFDLIGVSDGA